MRYPLCLCLVLIGSLAAGSAADGETVKTDRARVSSPGLIPDAGPTQSADLRRKRIVEPPPQAQPVVAAQQQDALVAPPQPSLSGRIEIICLGSGTAVKQDDSDITGDVFATVNGTRDRAFTDQVDVELAGQTGRIRLPRTMLPPMNGGKAGWFELRKLQVTDRAINASVAVNFINKPKVHIDRVTGTITIAGKNGDYNGRCKKVDPAAQRQF